MIAPPEGLNEADYDTIEAAVMETARGRWFLAEFARRSRVDETRQILDAFARLEQVVREQQASPADPSIRLLVQRLKDVSQSLGGMVAEMRTQGLDEKFCAGIEAQARAVSGLLRLNNPPPLPRREPPPALPETVPQPGQKPQVLRLSQEAQRVALERLDQLSIAEKLALFA
jgi:hypothetical protein